MATDGPNVLASWSEPGGSSHPIWRQAHTDLMIKGEASRLDPVLWERAVRVAQLAVSIITFPELAEQRIDRNALIAAALYHDAGWAIQFRGRHVSRAELLTRPTNDTQRELAATLLEQRLAPLLPEDSLRTAAQAVRECTHKSSERVEAHILAEATNLDDIGPHAICPMIRRQVAEGKGLDSVLDAWHRQQEYHYWDARLKECFRYETTRRLAQQRFEAVERFMNDLRRVHRLEDIAEFLERVRASSPATTPQ